MTRAEDLLKNSDIISIHVILGDRYKHLITKKEFDMMKKSSFLINTSRVNSSFSDRSLRWNFLGLVTNIWN